MNEFSKTLKYIPEQGELKIGPLRYLLMRPDTLCEIQKGIEDRLGSGSFEYIYAAGSSWTVAVMKRLKAALGEEIEELTQAFCQHATDMGWGHWKLEFLKPTEYHLGIRVMCSPIAEAYGESDKAVCHLICGAVSGLAESLFRMPASCSEVTCKAQGNPDCVFVARGHDVAGAESWSW